MPPSDHHPAGGLSTWAHVLPAQPPLLLDMVIYLTVIPRSPGHILVLTSGPSSFVASFVQMYIMNYFLAMESCTFMIIAYEAMWPICHTLKIPIHHHWVIYSQGGHFYLIEMHFWLCLFPSFLLNSIIMGNVIEGIYARYLSQTLLWWCPINTSPPVCWRLDSAGIWPHILIFLILHPHTEGCSETQVRRSCCKGLKHIWLPLYPDPLL